MSTHFSPTRLNALECLGRFVKQAGVTYTSDRNYDNGAGQHSAVSCLSPYIRCRLITEDEVLTAVTGHYSPRTAEKFIQEVYWRTYFKGWLELRPQIWDQYKIGVSRALSDVQTQDGLRQGWEAACNGSTGIACFDSWAHELRDTGYLHNHARMWFASIWIFTLRLPWELGADFFLRHLLDGDPAANTLSWRWVGGLHTRGKHYLARAWNIERYTRGRFNPVGDLNEEALPLPAQELPKLGPAPVSVQPIPGSKIGFILHDDELSPGFLLSRGVVPMSTATLSARAGLSPLAIAPAVDQFARNALDDAEQRWSEKLGPRTPCTTSQDLAAWAKTTGANLIVAPYAPVGPVSDVLQHAAELMQVDGIRLIQPIRSSDARAWPHASAGYFKFKQAIPQLLMDLRAA